MNCQSHTCNNKAQAKATEFFFTGGFSKHPFPVFRAHFCEDHNKEVLDYSYLHGKRGGCQYAENLIARTEREKRLLKISHRAEDFWPLILLAFCVIFYICLEVFS